MMEARGTDPTKAPREPQNSLGVTSSLPLKQVPCRMRGIEMTLSLRPTDLTMPSAPSLQERIVTGFAISETAMFAARVARPQNRSCGT